MQIANILSKRFVEDWPSYHIIYEWENVLAAKLAIPIINSQPWQRRALVNRYTKKLAGLWGSKAFRWLNNTVETFGMATDSTKSLVFELYVGAEPSFSTSPKAVPVMIDFWKQTDLSAFYDTYRECALVLISSLEVMKHLQANHCPLNIAHFPLSLADTYHLEDGKNYRKTYDILFAGRANPVLLAFMHRFIEKFPSTEFLQQEQINGELHYVSNQRGIIGKFHSRSEYMELLRASKVSFYSTPGIDGGEKRTGGFNLVTPRFLELLSAQCLLLGRYPNNEETDFYELPRVCPDIQSYEEFEVTLLGYLNQEQSDFSGHRAVLEKHYTSRRAQQLREIFDQQELLRG